MALYSNSVTEPSVTSRVRFTVNTAIILDTKELAIARLLEELF
jgi:hypothetical protein